MSDLTATQIYQKEWRLKNKDKMDEYYKQYRINNKEVIKERNRLYRLKKKNEEKEEVKEEVKEEKFFDSKEVAQAKYDEFKLKNKLRARKRKMSKKMRSL